MDKVAFFKRRLDTDQQLEQEELLCLVKLSPEPHAHCCTSAWHRAQALQSHRQSSFLLFEDLSSVLVLF